MNVLPKILVDEIIVIGSEQNPFVPENSTITLTQFSPVIKFEKSFPHISPKSETLAAILCTSGTTSNPKGCVLLHSGFIASAAAIALDTYEFSPNDSYVSYLPLAHIMELIIHVTGLHCLETIEFYSENVARLLDEVTFFVQLPLLVFPQFMN
jgi:long-chain acyl-CoA synthetase